VMVVFACYHVKSIGNDRFRSSLVDFERSPLREGERRRGMVSVEGERKKKREKKWRTWISSRVA
ncbi:hypothetical protein BHE74_00055694, partial [Ensete ventricosum]